MSNSRSASAPQSEPHTALQGRSKEWAVIVLHGAVPHGLSDQILEALPQVSGILRAAKQVVIGGGLSDLRLEMVSHAGGLASHVP